MNITNIEIKSVKDSRYICFSNQEDNQYLLLDKNGMTKAVYLEWNDQSHSVYDGIQTVILDGNELILHLNDLGEKSLLCEHIKIHLSLSPECFQDLKLVLSQIFATFEITEKAFIHYKPLNIDYKKIHHLDLSGKNLSKPPDSLHQYENLTSLNLLDNDNLDLEGVFEIMAGINSLTSLRVSFNGIVPSNINKVKSLKNLFIQGSADFNTWPHDTQNLINLETLTIQSDYQVNLPNSLSILTNLNSMAVIAPNWTLPNDFYKLSKLEILDLFYCSSNLFPKEMEQMHSLKEIYLGYNEERDDLHTLTSFGELPNLETLEIAVKDLPKSIGLLTKLKALTIYSSFDHPHVLKLPDALFNLPHLESLRFIECPEVIFPDEIRGSISITHLSFERCSFGKLPTGIDKLKHIHTLTINECERITSLPQELINLKYLKKLYINENERLTSLPNEFIKMINLEEIQLDNNENIVNVPEHWIKKMIFNNQG